MAGEVNVTAEGGDLESGSGDDAFIGQTIGGRYAIIAKIGAGGMGSVYKAEHSLLGRTVALKLLHSNLLNSPEYTERFKREALVASKLNHPNAITLFDFGLEGNKPYLVMQYVEGTTLKDALIGEGALPLQRISAIMDQICSALGEAHGLGIVHRDLKPDNIMLTRRTDGVEVARILDFGIAKPMLSGDGVALTQAGSFMGTPQYMSPEQALDRQTDSRADIYSLGVILYEMITGEVPFKSISPVEMLFKHVNDLPIPVRTFKPDMNIPEPISAIVSKALEKDPEKRFQKVEELSAAFREALRPGAPPVQVTTSQAGPALSNTESKPENKAGAYSVLGGIALLLIAAVALIVNGMQGDEASETALVEEKAAPVEEIAPVVAPFVAPTEKPVEAASVLPKDAEYAAEEVKAPEKIEKTEESTASQPLPDNPAANASTEVKEATTALGPILGPDVDQQRSEAAKIETAPETSEVVVPPALATENITPSSGETAQPLVEIKTDEIVQATTPSIASDEAQPAPAESEFSVMAIAGEVRSRPIKDARNDSDKFLSEGKRLISEQRYDEAASSLKKSLLSRHTNIAARLSMGLALLRLNQPALALEHFELAQRQDPNYPPVYYNLASYYAWMGDAGRSIEKLKRAIALYPKFKSWISTDPDFDKIRTDPDFQAFLAK
jgi:hypothetical protein